MGCSRQARVPAPGVGITAEKYALGVWELEGGGVFRGISGFLSWKGEISDSGVVSPVFFFFLAFRLCFFLPGRGFVVWDPGTLGVESRVLGVWGCKSYPESPIPLN